MAAFRLFVFWSVRFLVVGGRGGLLDRNYAIAAQKVGAGTIKTAKQLAAELADIIPTDAMFETAFAEARVSKAFLARYFLRALEMKRKGNPEPEFVPSDDEMTINLEHVLPENPDVNWPNIAPELAGAYYNRLGNLVILQASKNSLIGNSSFTDKQPILKASAYILTSDVANKASWGIVEINDRQKDLAALAVKTWPLA